MKIVSAAWWVLLGLVFLIVLVLRIRLLPYPLERDEGEYAYAGQLMLEGIPPYKLAYNMKFPGTYAAYALIMALFGQTTIGIHIGLLLVNAATCVLLYFLTRRVFGSHTSAIAAASAYAILSISPDFYGFSAHATQFIALLITAASWLLLAASERDSVRPVFGAGVVFGLAVIMKQPAAVFVVFGAAYLWFADVRRRLPLKQIVGRCFAFSCGSAMPLALTLLLLWWAGVFQKFWFWTIQYASQYGSLVPFTTGLGLLGRQLEGIIPTHAPLLLMAALGAVLVFLKENSDRRFFIVGLLLASITALSAGLYFRPHYFFFVLPVLAILAGGAVTGIEGFLKGRSRSLHVVAVILFGGALIWSIIDERDLLWRLRPDIASKWIYSDAPFPETVEISDFIREHSEPGDTVAVIGSEPQIYFLSHRRSATGYIYTYALMEPQKFAPIMQLEMWEEIEKARPRYIVNVALATSWNARPESDLSILTKIDDYVAQHYSAVGMVNIGEHETQYDFDHPNVEKAWPTGIIIYERKSTASRGW